MMKASKKKRSERIAEAYERDIRNLSGVADLLRTVDSEGWNVNGYEVTQTPADTGIWLVRVKLNLLGRFDRDEEDD